MNKHKHVKKKNPNNNDKLILCWKSSRALVSRPIPLELDLDNRKIFLNDEALAVHRLQINSKNLDTFIHEYIDPAQEESIIDMLEDAGKGIEKPIPFCFVHPTLRKKICFEYRYSITYVSYATTRLIGELINVRPKSGNNRRKSPIAG